MNRLRRLVLASGMAAALGACATWPRPAGELPAMRLSPASLGRSLALQQQLTVTAHGRTQQIDVAFEADADGVRLAMLVLGQAAGRIEWDGVHLREARAPGWPAFVRAERILGDLQLVFWPAAALRAALPAGWELDADAAHRTLAHRGRAMIEVRYLDAQVAELTNYADDYRIRVESREASS